MEKNIFQIEEVLDVGLKFKTDILGGKEIDAVWNNDKSEMTLRSIIIRREDLIRKILERGEKVVNTVNPPLKPVGGIGHRKRKFTEEQEKEIVDRYTHSNTPKKELARAYGCTPKTIRNIINKAHRKEY